jgi:hypothetical protein
MFRAIGMILILLTLSKMFGSAFVALEKSAVAVFGLVETSAQVASLELENQ